MIYIYRGLGALIAEKFATEGCHIAINYVSNLERARETAVKIEELLELSSSYDDDDEKKEKKKKKEVVLVQGVMFNPPLPYPTLIFLPSFLSPYLTQKRS